jgi:hypothetical protein
LTAVDAQLLTRGASSAAIDHHPGVWGIGSTHREVLEESARQCLLVVILLEELLRGLHLGRQLLGQEGLGLGAKELIHHPRALTLPLAVHTCSRIIVSVIIIIIIIVIIIITIMIITTTTIIIIICRTCLAQHAERQAAQALERLALRLRLPHQRAQLGLGQRVRVGHEALHLHRVVREPHRRREPRTLRSMGGTITGGQKECWV